MGAISLGLEVFLSAVKASDMAPAAKLGITQVMERTIPAIDGLEDAVENPEFSDLARAVTAAVAADTVIAIGAPVIAEALALTPVAAFASPLVIPVLTAALTGYLAWQLGDAVIDPALEAVGEDLADAGLWIADLFGVSFNRRDPLVLDLNHDGVRLIAQDDTTTHFDLDADGFAERVGWVSPQDGLLAIDHNSNGLIDNGNELFGTDALNGFEVLRQYDQNSDGVISSADAVFAALRIWQDANKDGISQSSELKTLSDHGISSISLSADVVSGEQAGNSILAEGSFTDQSGTLNSILAVGFSSDQLNTRFILPANFEYDPDVLSLPNLRGYGEVPDLWVAMTLDPTLKTAVQNFINSLSSDASPDGVVGHGYMLTGLTQSGQSYDIRPTYDASSFDEILAKWASISVHSGNDDAVQVQETAEAFMGRPAANAYGNAQFYDAFQIFAGNLATRFIAQVSNLETSAASLNFIKTILDAVGDNTYSETFAQSALAGYIADLQSAAENSVSSMFDGIAYDFFSDKLIGDVRTFIDEALSTHTVDPNNPWLGYASWYADNRLSLIALDPDGSELAQAYRALTGNEALTILTVPHGEVTGTSGDDLLVGDQNGANQPDLIKGGGGDDTLKGGGGSDAYVVTDDGGHDVIIDASGSSDELAFQGTFSSDDAIYSFADGQHRDLMISFAGRSETVLIKDYFDTDGNATLERITFPDGIEVAHQVIRDAVYLNLATGGHDVITGFELGTHIEGAEGNDQLQGLGGADVIRGGSGSDTLIGNFGNDTLEGGSGDDVLQGGAGNDVYRYNLGDGSDRISETTQLANGFDALEFGPGISPADILVSQADNGDDLILAIAGSGTITIDNGNTAAGYRIDIVRFADGSEWSFSELFERSIVPTSGNDLFYGSADSDYVRGDGGNDTLEGRDGNDRLEGGAGDDVMRGGRGNDTYIVGVGSGHDFISEHTQQANGDDILQFGPGIALGDLAFAQADGGNDVVISFGSSSVTLDNVNTGDPAYQIETLRFADGTTISHAEMMVRAMAGTSNHDTIFGTEGADNLSGLEGDDFIKGSAGDDTIRGGAGNDRLEGVAGNDVYLFDRGDGQDSIWENDQFANGFDILKFGPGIAPSDVSVHQADGGQDIVLKISGTTDQVTLDNMNVANLNYRIERVDFADGTSWTFADLIAFATAGTSGNDVLYGDSDANLLSGLAGNDTLVGNAGNDTLDGGGGADRLEGGGGNDVYLFGRGSGQDIATENTWQANGLDTLRFGPNIVPTDLAITLGNNGADYVISILGTSDQITLKDGNTSPDYRIEDVMFDDGTVMSVQALYNLLNVSGEYPGAISGGAGADSVYGTNGTDTILGGLGNDYLEGRGGSDTYIYRSGDGNDEIFDENFTGGSDTLWMVDLDPNQIELRRDGFHLFVKDLETGQEIKVSYQWHPPYDQGVEQILFADGSSWDRARILSEAWYRGTDSNDSIVATDDANTIMGGLGNDYLEGKGGSDTYIYRSGDGNDEIFDENFSGGFETLKLIDINPDGVELRRDGFHLFIKDLNTSQEVKISYQWHPPYDQGIEQIDFADGTTWDRSRILSEAWYRGTGSNDSIVATDDANTIMGGLGNDYLEGKGGSDTYIYRSGDGNDEIFDENFSGGFETLKLIDIDPDDVELRRDGFHLFVKDLNTGQEVKISYQWHPPYDQGIEAIEFGNGAVWDRTQINSLAATGGNDSLSGTANADHINALSGNDTLVGGAGADTMIGGSGSDLFQFGAMSSLVVNASTDVVVDFEDGIDRISLGYTPQAILIGSAQPDFAAARSAAQVLTDMNPGGGDAAAVQVGNNTYLFYAGDQGAILDSAIQFSNLSSSTLSLADFI